MSFSTTAIKYGWVYLTALGVITGTTIYVASNTRQQVKPEDIIEIALGVHERCLATQITTNPTYSVDPPSIVRTWTDTNGASIIVTNTIGWHTDRAMMVDLDTKIKALCPYYVDTNSVYDGTTNIIMHTFTGLLTSLDLGDHTNFTAIPAIGTNIATYGPWAWRNYIVAWQERYKVLNALKMTAPSDYSMVATNQIGGFAYNHFATNVSVWAALKASIDTNMAGPPTAFIGTFTFATATSAHEPNTGIWAEPDAWKQVWKDSTFSWSNITVLDGTMFWFVSMTNMTGDDFGVPYVTNNFVTGYDANGIPNPLNGQLYIWGEEVVAASNGVIFSVNLSSDATWCVAPSWDTGWTHWNWRIPFPSDPYVTLVSTRGCKLREHKAVFQPTFLYCTNKYW